MYPQHRVVDVVEIQRWSDWFKCLSHLASLPILPDKLLTLFVAQSLLLADSDISSFYERPPRQFVDTLIRGYFLEKVLAYHLTSALVQKDVDATGSKMGRVDPIGLLVTCRKVVARIMLQKRGPSGVLAVRAAATRAVLSTFKPAESR